MSDPAVKPPETELPPGKGWSPVRGSEPNTVSQAVSKIPEDKLEIEIVDDRPKADQVPPRDPKVPPYEVTDEELRGHSEKAQDRIKKLRYEYHEERRYKEAAQREQAEALRLAQSAMRENERLNKELTERSKVAIDQARERAKADAALAQQLLAKATEAGKPDEAAKHQADMSRAIAQEVNLSNWQPPVAPPSPQPQFQPQLQQPPKDERAEKWQEKNKWFGDDEVMTGAAYGLHERLVKRDRIDPRSDDYYQKIDEGMRHLFPEKFDDGAAGETPPAPAVAPRPQIVAAPTRSVSTPRKVQLTATQAAIAKRLGLTLEQYANQLVKEQSNG